MRRAVALLAAGGLAAAGLIAPMSQSGIAQAAGFVVDDAGDATDATPGDGQCRTAGSTCTLRAAIVEADALAGTDTITVPAMAITVGSRLSISSNLTIQGAGARATVLSADATPHDMLYIANGSVTLRGLTIRGATGGGALAVNQEGGAVTLDRVRVVDNQATSVGTTYAPVYAYTGSLTIKDSEISGNTTTTSGSAYGGALAVYGAVILDIVNSTIADNTVNAANVLGGAVWAGQNAMVTLRGATVAGNSASGSVFGASLFQHTSGTGSTEISQSVIAAAGTTLNCYSGAKPPAVTGRTLVSDTSCAPASDTVLVGDPKLRALGNYGGPTDSRPPMPASPILNRATTCVTPADQRGQNRPIAGTCDLGAVELGADRGVAQKVSNSAPNPGGDIVVTTTVRNKGMDTTTGTRAVITFARAGKVLSADPTTGACTIAGAVVTCPVGSLAKGKTVRIYTSVRSPATGVMTATATVKSDQPDPHPTDNTVVTTVRVKTPVIKPCTVVRNGTPKPDVLSGTAKGDSISGRAGNDRISGLGGPDCVNGDDGDDIVTGGPGADRLTGGNGRDTVNARDGVVDKVWCGAGLDTVNADPADIVATNCETVKRN